VIERKSPGELLQRQDISSIGNSCSAIPSVATDTPADIADLKDVRVGLDQRATTGAAGPAVMTAMTGRPGSAVAGGPCGESAPENACAGRSSSLQWTRPFGSRMPFFVVDG